MKDPSIPKGAKQEALDAILDKLECEDITKNFFGGDFVISTILQIII